MNKILKYKAAYYYIMASVGAAIVTYVLPGTAEDEAFVDGMGIMLSLIFLVFGVIYAAIGAMYDIERIEKEGKL